MKQTNIYDLTFEITLFDYDNKYKFRKVEDKLCTDDYNKIQEQIKKCKKLKQNYTLYKLIECDVENESNQQFYS